MDSIEKQSPQMAFLTKSFFVYHEHFYKQTNCKKQFSFKLTIELQPDVYDIKK